MDKSALEVGDSRFEIGLTEYLTHRSIGDILKMDESCTSNPKSRNIRLDGMSYASWFRGGLPVQLKISDFGFEVQDSSNFKVSSRMLVPKLLQY